MSKAHNSEDIQVSSSANPERLATQQDARKKRKNRREYALLTFEFERGSTQAPSSNDMPDPSDRTVDGGTDKAADLRRRVERYYGNQTLVPHVSVSPCISAIDRERRARRSRIREPEAEGPQTSILETGTFCVITPLLQQPTKTKSVVQTPEHVQDNEWADDDLPEDEVPDMLLSEDEDDPGKEFEMVKYEPMSEHNGTVRRWYRGLRH